MERFETVENALYKAIHGNYTADDLKPVVNVARSTSRNKNGAGWKGALVGAAALFSGLVAVDSVVILSQRPHTESHILDDLNNKLETGQNVSPNEVIDAVVATLMTSNNPDMEAGFWEAESITTDRFSNEPVNIYQKGDQEKIDIAEVPGYISQNRDDIGILSIQNTEDSFTVSGQTLIDSGFSKNAIGADSIVTCNKDEWFSLQVSQQWNSSTMTIPVNSYSIVKQESTSCEDATTGETKIIVGKNETFDLQTNGQKPSKSTDKSFGFVATDTSWNSEKKVTDTKELDSLQAIIFSAQIKQSETLDQFTQRWQNGENVVPSDFFIAFLNTTISDPKTAFEISFDYPSIPSWVDKDIFQLSEPNNLGILRIDIKKGFGIETPIKADIVDSYSSTRVKSVVLTPEAYKQIALMNNLNFGSSIRYVSPEGTIYKLTIANNATEETKLEITKANGNTIKSGIWNGENWIPADSTMPQS